VVLELPGLRAVAGGPRGPALPAPGGTLLTPSLLLLLLWLRCRPRGGGAAQQGQQQQQQLVAAMARLTGMS
jgi:hypothetical protein